MALEITLLSNRPNSSWAARLRLLALLCLVASEATVGAQEAPAVGPLGKQPFIRMTGDVLGYELLPSFNGKYKYASFRTNRWGMRDREYSEKPPANTYRIALIGSSFSMGAGVSGEQVHEAILEERLNREGPGAPRRKYEILNFSVGGYGILQNVAVTESKVFPFSPDVVFLIVHAIEPRRMTIYLSGLIRAGIPLHYPYVTQKVQERGAEHWMEEVELRRRLAPVAPDLVRWSFRQIAEVARKRGVPVVGIVFPMPGPGGRSREMSVVSGFAAEAGIPLISLEGVYDSYPERAITLGNESQADVHLNAFGHKVVAQRLFELLTRDDARLLNLGSGK